MGTLSQTPTPSGKARPPSPTFVLVHSPLVGPTTWHWTAHALSHIGFDVIVPSLLGFQDAGPPYWEPCVQSVVHACAPLGGPFVVVGHSGAGPLLPAIELALLGRVQRLVFAEAALPPPSGFAEAVPSWLRAKLSGLAVNGRLPKWSTWWDTDAMEHLVPAPQRRRLVEEELPELPLDYVDGTIPVPDGWSKRVPCTYLYFSKAYRTDADEAKTRGWPVRRIGGEHLHMVVQPTAVARELMWESG